MSKVVEDIAKIPKDLGKNKSKVLPVISSLNLDEEEMMIPTSLPALEDSEVYDKDTQPFDLEDEEEEETKKSKKEIPASVPDLDDDDEEEVQREEELKEFIKEIDDSKEFSIETRTFIVKIVEKLEEKIVDFNKQETKNFIKSLPEKAKKSVKTLMEKNGKDKNAMKGSIVRVLYDLILEEVIEIEDVTPWDVKRKLQENKGYVDLYEIDKSKKMEVGVTVEGKEFKHELTDEFVFGLLVYSKITKYPIDIKMFGDILTLPKRVEKKPKEEKYFQASVNKKTSFFFETPSFMQGINTGAMWAKHTEPVFTSIKEYTSEGEFDIVVE
jgi:hypothetical protein